MKVHDYVAEALRREGVSTGFGVMGDGNMLLWASAIAAGLTIRSARHEGAAVGMADGFSRATHNIGVAFVTYGPGLTQAATAMLTAARNRSSLVILTGDLPTGDREQLQRLDQRRFVESCEAAFLSAGSPRLIRDRLRQAFHIAASQRKPVVLSIPLDTQQEEMPDATPYDPLPPPPEPALVMPPATALARLASALEASERPVFVVGRGAADAAAASAVAALAERCGALLATTLPVKGLFRGQPFDLGVCGGYATAPAEKLIKGADLVIGFGAALGYFTTRGGELLANASIYRVDTRDIIEDCTLVPGHHVRGDAKWVAEALRDGLAPRPRYRTATTRETLAWQPPARDPVSDGMDPRDAMRALSAVLPANAQIALGLGHFLGFAAMYLDIPRSASCHYSYAFGSIGQALALGLGLSAGAAGRPSFVIDGDGGTLMSLQELETATRERLQLILVICNDAGYGAELHKLRARGIAPSIAAWASPDFVAVARALGGDGVRIEQAEAIGPAVQKGLSQGGLFVIDARMSPTSVNDSFGRAYFGRPNQAPRLTG